jgi:hypothetical protein
MKQRDYARMSIILGLILVTVLQPTIIVAQTSTIDIKTLIEACLRNEEEMARRMYDYSFTDKVINRWPNKKGELVNENMKVLEIYPTRGRDGAVQRLVIDHGKPLSPEEEKKRKHE